MKAQSHEAINNAEYIEVEAGVRYWDDAVVNGEEDTDGKLIPMRQGNCWCPIIRISDGMVIGWPQGTSASVHFKVCDDGEYWLLDGERNRVAKWAGFYVPEDFLCHGDRGYGDYIILSIADDGMINGWMKPQVEVVCECDNNAQSGWMVVE